MGISHRFGCVALLCAATGIAAADTELAPADLGWSADATAATFKLSSHVLAAAGHGRRLAAVAKGTRVTWHRIVSTQDTCKAWLELDVGWACATELAPVTAPTATTAARPNDHWADVNSNGADAYDDLDALRARAASRHVNGKTYVAVRGSNEVLGGVRYFFTDQGWIAGSDLTMADAAASVFAGIDLTPSAHLDFAWAVAKKPGAKIPVHDSPDEGAKVVNELSPRDMVTVRELAGDWARIGDHEWTLAVELRKPAKQARPEGIGEHERWIDVDIDQQVLMAYDGETPVFVTLVSTGRPYLWGTPTGIYRIRDKAPVARMQYTPPEVIPGVTEQWDVADVPYVMGFRKNFALHGTYWHDGFGRQRSHGCVNLSPTDAKRVYDFVLPRSPEGFTDVESDGDGTPVQIRNHYDPAPKWLDYNGHSMKSVAAK